MKISAKERIANALVSLMKEGDYESLTITDIVERADVSRVSFYRNFESKEDVLSYLFNQLWTRWNAVHHTYEATEDYRRQFEETLEFFISIKSFLNLIYEANMSHILYRHLDNLIGPTPDDVIEDRYRRAYYTHATFGLYNEWIVNGMKETPKEMAELYHEGIMVSSESLARLNNEDEK